MSSANLDVVRRIYDAVARRDDATPFELYAEGIVWDLSNSRRAALYDKPVYHGHEGVRENWRESVAAFGDIDFEVEELIETGGHVFATIREHEVGRASGVPVEAIHFAVWTLAGGKVVRLQVFDDRDQAAEAAGSVRDTARGMPESRPEDVETVRRAHEHFATTGEPMWEINDPAIEVFDHDIPDASNPYRGQEGVAQWLSDFAESWDSFAMDLERVVEAGDRVVSLFRIRAVGAGSGVSVERGDAMVWTFRDGKVVRLDYFNDQRQALEAAGV